MHPPCCWCGVNPASGCINWQPRTPTHQDGSHLEPHLPSGLHRRVPSFVCLAFPSCPLLHWSSIWAILSCSAPHWHSHRRNKAHMSRWCRLKILTSCVSSLEHVADQPRSLGNTKHHTTHHHIEDKFSSPVVLCCLSTLAIPPDWVGLHRITPS
jgi:hypothetical protein